MKTEASKQPGDTRLRNPAAADRALEGGMTSPQPPLPPVEELDRRRRQLETDIDLLRSEIRIREETEMFFH